MFSIMVSMLPSFLSVDSNLAFNLPYEVAMGSHDSALHHIEQTTIPDTGQLTRSQPFAPSSFLTLPISPYTGFLRQDSRDVTVDLGHSCMVHRIEVKAMQQRLLGIQFPHQIQFLTSPNKLSWTTVATVYTHIPLYRKDLQHQTFITPELNIHARYVRLHFYTNVWVTLSDLRVYGQQSFDVPRSDRIQSRVMHIKVASQSIKSVQPKYTVKHAQVLIYNGYYPKKSIGKWTKQAFLPYVAYVDKNGAIQDTLFSEFLFLPFSTAPSGGRFGDGTSKRKDWAEFSQQLFTDDTGQLTALDMAAAETSVKLGRPIKLDVTIAIPFIGVSGPFHAAIEMNPEMIGYRNVLDSRVHFVKQYVDDATSKFQSKHYAHLTLTGFYWVPECVHYTLSPLEDAVIQLSSQYIHHRGPYRLEWIPFFQAEGYRHWADNGFDVALMQPNYIFGGGPDRLTVARRLAQQYDLGSELEMDYRVLNLSAKGIQARQAYVDYLQQLTPLRANELVAWYQGYQVLRDAAESPNARVRNVYDLTYRWIKDSKIQYKNGLTKIETSPLPQQTAMSRPFPDGEQHLNLDPMQENAMDHK